MKMKTKRNKTNNDNKNETSNESNFLILVCQIVYQILT
jgi:hypothetical protein